MKYTFVKQWHRRNMNETRPAGAFSGDLVGAVLEAARLVNPLDPHDEWSEVHIFDADENHVGTVGRDRWCYSMWKLFTSMSREQV